MQAKLALIGVVLGGTALVAGCSSGTNTNNTNRPTTRAPAASATAASAPSSTAGTTTPSVATGGGAGTTGTATTPLRTQDRDQIQQVVQAYLGALLQQRDQTQLRQYLRTGVQDQQLQQARDQIRAHDYHLVAITDITVTGDQAAVTVRLQDRDGTEVTRTLQLERDQDQWRIRDPALGGS